MGKPHHAVPSRIAEMAFSCGEVGTEVATRIDGSIQSPSDIPFGWDAHEMWMCIKGLKDIRGKLINADRFNDGANCFRSDECAAGKHCRDVVLNSAGTCKDCKNQQSCEWSKSCGTDNCECGFTCFKPEPFDCICSIGQDQ